MTAMSLSALRRVITVAVTATALLVISGTAFAYWKTTGSGTGTASTAASRPGQVALAVTATVSGVLLPDGVGHTVTVSITNNNSFAVTITAATIGLPTQSFGTAPNDCTPANNAITVTSPSFTNVVVSGSGGAASIPLNGAVQMGVGSVNACQGRSFTTLPVTLTAGA